jgi:hypothetical protein
MKRRPSPPPVVVTKTKRTVAGTSAAPAARGAPPDRRIRAWNADDVSFIKDLRKDPK